MCSENIEFGIMLISSLFVLHNFLIDVADDSQEWWKIAEVENDDGDTEGAILDDPRYHETRKTRDILMRHIQGTRSSVDDEILKRLLSAGTLNPLPCEKMNLPLISCIPTSPR